MSRQTEAESAMAAIPEETLRTWEARGVSRRDFLTFCSTMAATLVARDRFRNGSGAAFSPAGRQPL